MQVPNNAKETLIGFLYLIIGYLTIGLLVTVGWAISETWESMFSIVFGFIGMIILYPLGRDVSKIIKKLFERRKQ